MNIKIASLVIKIKLLYKIKNVENYVTNLKEEYKIISYNDFNLNLVNPKIENDYFSLYSFTDYNVLKINEGGYIKLESKNVYLYPTSAKNEYLLCQYAIDYLIQKYANGLTFHSSIIDYNGIGIAYTAKSGTGKSTQRMLFEKYYDVKCVNDDKNIIVLENDELFVYSSPWSGKHNVNNNIRTKLKYILFIYQNDVPKLDEIDEINAFKLLLSQVGLAFDYSKDSWNRIIDKMLSLRLYRFGTTVSKDSIDIIKKKVDEDNANK